MTFKHPVLWWIKSLLSRVPVYGQLVNSSRESFGAAVRDVFITTTFSLLPLWLYPTFLHLGFDQPFWGTLRLFVASGEFFIYSAALVGPLIYTITKTYGEEVADPDAGNQSSSRRQVFPRIKSIQFPYGYWFVLISIVVCCFAALFFGIMRAKTLNVLPLQPDEDTLFLASAVLYLFTLSCVFCVSVYRVNLENGAREFGDDTRDLMRQWERQHDR